MSAPAIPRRMLILVDYVLVAEANRITAENLDAGDGIWVRAEFGSAEIVVIRGPARIAITAVSPSALAQFPVSDYRAAPCPPARPRLRPITPSRGRRRPPGAARRQQWMALQFVVVAAHDIARTDRGRLRISGNLERVLRLSDAFGAAIDELERCAAVLQQADETILWAADTTESA